MIALVAVAAMLVLSNLSYDGETHLGHVWPKSYGWPLIWHRYVAVSWEYGDWRTVGWYYSPARLIANLAMWLVMLAIASAACEWPLRRYRPRIRWSLRTMLAGVALAAALCGWFAAARQRAELQDPIIVELRSPWGNSVAVKRWGPKWLDLFGVDRYRRTIVGVGGVSAGEAGAASLSGAARITSLEFLACRIDRVTPEVAAALNDMRQLRELCIERVLNDDPEDDDKELERDERLPPIGNLLRLEDLEVRGLIVDNESLASLAKLKTVSLHAGCTDDKNDTFWRRNLAAIGGMSQLEHLEFVGLRLRDESLAHLAGLTHLKSLDLGSVTTEGSTSLGCLPSLPRLEWLDLGSADINDENLRCIVAQRQLKTLSLYGTSVTAAGMAELAPLEFLEELEIDGEMASAELLQALGALKRLKTLHLALRVSRGPPKYAALALDDGKKLFVRATELDRVRRAMQSLRKVRPGIVIDGGYITTPRNQGSLHWWDAAEVAERPNSWMPPMTWLPASDMPWMTATEAASFKSQGGWARFDAARWPDKITVFEK
jgi:hypothetical protein